MDYNFRTISRFVTLDLLYLWSLTPAYMFMIDD